ncbi:MAG: S41 family peptidase [Anaerolineae bacterium]
MTQTSPMNSSPSPLRGGKILILLLVVMLCVSSFGAGAITVWLATNPALSDIFRTTSATTPTPEATPQLTREDGIKLLAQIMDILDAEYINPSTLDDATLLYGAASGLVAAVGDSHTMFQEPVAAGFEQERMDGAFEGIGANVEMRDDKLIIALPLPGSPALKAGILPDDVVLAVDGQSIAGLSITDAVKLIRGPRGSQVKLTIQRAGIADPLIVTVTRDRIEVASVVSKMLDGNIAYVRLAIFNAVATKQLTEALRDLLAQKPIGLILDLRGNPGGYLTTAIEVASLFLPRNTLILSEVRRDQPVEEYLVKSPGQATKIPLVVLVDGASASASEIVAGAVQDSGRGVIIGSRSYGKGSVQATHDMVNGSSLRVTIAKWNRPNGANIDGNGIKPDIEVSFAQTQYEAGEDPQLERAVQELSKGQ